MQARLTIVDSLVLIGRGQREFIIGDRQTGKIVITIDTILNQKQINAHVTLDNEIFYCVYVIIKQKHSTVAQLAQILLQTSVLKYHIIVATIALDPISL
jgi:F0F1-type ATP synthase alpha subunit